MLSENYTKKSAINSAVGLSTNIISCVVGFVSRAIFLRILTTEYLGVNGLFSNILTILSFAELGIGEAMAYAMYKPIKENQQKKARALIAFYRKAYRTIALLVFLIGFVLSFFLNHLITEKPNISEKIHVLFWLFLLNNIVSYFAAYKQAILIVDQKQYVISLIGQLVRIGQIAFQCIILFLTRNYYLYLILQIAGTLFTNLLLSIYVRRKYPWLIKKSSEKLNETDKNAIFKDIRALSISKVAGVVSNGSDNIITTKLFGLVSVGLISNYNMVITTINGFVWSALSSITGSVGQFNVDSSLERKRSIFSEIYLITFWIYAIVCICLMVLIDPFILVWLGEKYLINKPISVALIFNIFVSGLNFPFYTFRTTSGIFDPMKYNYVLYAATNIVLSIVLGSCFGLEGIFIATVIARLICAEWKEGRIVYRDILRFKFCKYILHYGISVSMLILVYFIVQFAVDLVRLEGWGGLIVKAIVCFCSINIIFIIAFSKSKAFKGLLQKAKKLFVGCA